MMRPHAEQRNGCRSSSPQQPNAATSRSRWSTTRPVTLPSDRRAAHRTVETCRSVRGCRSPPPERAAAPCSGRLRPMGDPLLLPKPGNARSDLLSAVARRIAERLDEPELVAVLLSGSATWGDADGTSDVDLVVLLDRPPPYREVVHRRITDLLGEAFPQGPLFADVDRLSASWFAESVLEPGGWAHRLVHGLVLRDRDGFLADLQRRAVAAFRRPEAYRARFAQFRALRDEESAGARAAADSGDGALARLRSRLGLGYAAASLPDLVDDRVSNHLVDAAVRGLATLGRADLGPGL